MLTGIALGSDSLDVVQRFDASLSELRASTWLAVQVPWPAPGPAASTGGPDVTGESRSAEP